MLFIYLSPHYIIGSIPNKILSYFEIVYIGDIWGFPKFSAQLYIRRVYILI